MFGKRQKQTLSQHIRREFLVADLLELRIHFRLLHEQLVAAELRLTAVRQASKNAAELRGRFHDLSGTVLIRPGPFSRVGRSRQSFESFEEAVVLRPVREAGSAYAHVLRQAQILALVGDAFIITV